MIQWLFLLFLEYHYYHVSMVVSYLYYFCLCNKTKMNFQAEYRWNTSVLNAVFNTTIYKSKFQIFSSHVTCCYEMVFQWYLYAPLRKFPFYVENVVFKSLMKVALRFGLVFVWTVSLLMIALILFVFKSSTIYGLLMVLVIIVLVLDKRIFVPLTLVSRPGINLLTSPNFHCDLCNLSTWLILVSLTSIIGNVAGNLFGLRVSLRLHKYSFCHLFQKWLKIFFNFLDSRIGLIVL